MVFLRAGIELRHQVWHCRQPRRPQTAARASASAWRHNRFCWHSDSYNPWRFLFRHQTNRQTIKNMDPNPANKKKKDKINIPTVI